MITDQTAQTIRVDYYAYPTEIADDTPDDYEFELTQDAQQVLPYAVVSDLLKTDPSADYTAFEVKFNNLVASLSPASYAGISFVGGIRIQEGDYMVQLQNPSKRTALSPRTRVYNGFTGVDFSSDSSKVSLKRSPNSINMYKNYSVELGQCVETRPGFRRMIEFPNQEDSIVYGYNFLR